MKGRRECFKVEILPDLPQRRVLDAVAVEAGSVKERVVTELARQYNHINLFQSRAEITEAVLSESRGGGLLEASVRRACSDGYASFLELVKSSGPGDVSRRSRRTRQTSVEVPKDEVIFSAFERSVRIPYVGVVRYRPNRFITPTDVPSENVAWLLSNITHVSVGASGNSYFLTIDCREESAADAGPRTKKRPRRETPSLLR